MQRKEHRMGTEQCIAVGGATDLMRVTVEEALLALGVHAEIGLASAEVDVRRCQHGYNEVPPKPGHPVLDFLKKFWGVSAWMLELILLVSWVLHKYTDLVVVSALLVVNALLSFVQERRAAGVVDALRQRLHVRARVLRARTWQLLPARELVPGDIVRVRQGDVVPADVKVMTGALGVDQSALTGEALEVDKGPADVLYAGAVVRHGEATGIVLLTGEHTYFGRTTELVQLARPKLHIEAVVARLVRWLFVIVGALLSVVCVVSLVRGLPLVELLPLLLVLLLSAVPVGLPVMFTVSMAVGAKALAKQGVLVTRLSATEDAAMMDVLCVDKTGTITMNQLSIAEVVPLHGFTAHDVLFYGALASQEANQDPIDLAFLAAAQQQSLLEHMGPITPITFTPFDPQTRRTEAVVELKGQRLQVMKGAVAAVAHVGALDASARETLETCIQVQMQHGYRMLAVAQGAEHTSLALVGLVMLYDPPRPEAQTLITTLRDLGVTVKMLTGDALPVARAIAQRVGLATVRRIADVADRADGVAVVAEDTDGFAEVYPEDKYAIVKSLQTAGHVVGMTGDGVNDAPALRQAEVGIAVRGATDVAKGAASVVLTQEGLVHIVQLVEQGRIIYQRILTWIINKISRTILKAGFVAIAYLWTGTFVVSAFSMMLLVFMTDFVKIALATDRVRWSTRPETWDLTGIITGAVVLGGLMVIEALGMLAIAWHAFALGAHPEALTTLSFQTLLYFALFSIVSAREERRFWTSIPSRTLLVTLILDAIVGTLLSLVGIPGLRPLPWEQTMMVFIYAMLCTLGINDFVKVKLITRHHVTTSAPRWSP